MMEDNARNWSSLSLLSVQQSEKVEIYFMAKNIGNYDSLSLEVSMQETNRPKKVVLRTKASKNSHNRIDFAETLIIEYFFEVKQRIFVEIFQENSRNLVALVESTVGQIFNGRNKGVSKEMVVQGRKVGELNLRCEKLEKGNNKYVQFEVSCRNLNVGFKFLCCCENSSQYRLYKIKNHQQYLLYESESHLGGTNRYNQLRINEKRLCNNDPKQPIIIRFYIEGGPSIGEAKFDLSMLTDRKAKHTLMKNGNENGIIVFQNVKQTVTYEFTDYLTAGMQMAMVVCIDFTASNGLQTRLDSLHSVTANKRSQYEQALNEVCSIVLDYDTDKLVPTFGFGAKVNMPNFNTGGKVHHCFPINGSQSNPNLFMLDGIIKGYRDALPALSFSGPTIFSPLLRQAMNVCQAMKSEVKEYMILLILTDGVIHDKEETMDLLVKCGKLPLSVIIIGIGNGEQGWKAMEELNDDDCLMTDFQGNKTQRDLVGFVQFSKHNNNGVELAREVLEELPRQVEEYHALVGMSPMDYQNKLVSDIVSQQLRNK